VLLGIDTSGSVSEEEYKEFMREVMGIIKQEDGVSVRKILFDAAIQDEEIVTTDTNTPDRSWYRYGYVGTSFEPFLKYALGKDTSDDWEPEARRENTPLTSPDLVLLFTDGYAPVGPSPNGPIPKYAPACPLIWVLTPDGQENPLMQSRVIRIKR
jgi:predicted metal-dependent peptidase